MQAEFFQVAAVVVLAMMWFAADSYARRVRRQARRSHIHRVQSFNERPEVIDAHALSASDD